MGYSAYPGSPRPKAIKWGVLQTWGPSLDSSMSNFTPKVRHVTLMGKNLKITY